MPKLTKRIIDATEPQVTEFFLWDENIVCAVSVPLI